MKAETAVSLFAVETIAGQAAFYFKNSVVLGLYYKFCAQEDNWMSPIQRLSSNGSHNIPLIFCSAVTFEFDGCFRKKTKENSETKPLV